MDLEQIQFQLERFIVFSGGPGLGIGEFVFLGTVAAIVWVIPVMARQVIACAVALLRAAVTAFASLSAVVAACLVLVVFVLTG